MYCTLLDLVAALCVFIALAAGVPNPASFANTAATSKPTALIKAPAGDTNGLTPNGIKAGVAGYRSLTNKADWTKFAPHLGWYSDYWPDTPNAGGVIGVGMLWGDGHLGNTQTNSDKARLDTFNSLSTPPKYMLGFYEPDWKPPDSSNIEPLPAARSWSLSIAPLRAKGTLVGSPSMATQKDEKWLTPFENAPQKPEWDFSVIHTNKPTIDGVKEDVEYYLAKYKKPVWVAEFACVEDKTWTLIDDDVRIATFIRDTVDFLQGNESVVAYGYSLGNGLGKTWPMINDQTGKITAAGEVYLEAVSKYH